MIFELLTEFILITINAFCIVLVWWVIRGNTTNKLKLWFTLMTIFILMWANFSFFGSISKDLSLALLFYRLNWFAVALFLPSFYYFFIVYFLEKKGWAALIGVFVVLGSVFLAYSSLLTDWIISDVVHKDWGVEVIFGVLSDTFNFFSALVAFLVVVYSIQTYRILSKDMKIKLQYFLSGVFVFILANLIFNVGFQVFFNSVQYQIFGDFSAIFLLVFTAYSIVRYELFDIRVITTEALTFIIWTVLVARLWTSDTLEQQIIDSAILLLTIIFGIMLIRSISREVKQREELEDLAKKLKFMDKQKDEFVSMAAHELRAPMTAIKGYLSMVLEGDAGEIPQKARGYVADVSSITDRLTRLVNNMLNVSRIEEGRLVYQVEIISLSRVAQMVYSEFEIEAGRKGLQIELEIPGDLKDRVKVDVDKIQEVMSNFVSNAVKYTDEGKVIMRLKESGVNKVRFEVEDTGPGISKEEQKRLFQKFYRAESNVGKTIGTGLGLYICKLLIEKFSGTLGLISDTNKGSLFWFELPVVQRVEGEDLSS